VCQNGGTCNNNAGSFECVCVPGWTGTHCERDINECAFLACMNGGTCRNTPGSFTCECTPGWTGRNCELDVNECLIPGICSPNATCTNTIGTYTCACNQGLVGDGVTCHGRFLSCFFWWVGPESNMLFFLPASLGPTLLTPNATDISGRMVLLTWVPEAHFEALQFVVEIDIFPYGDTFQVDTQRFVYGPVVRTLVDGLTPYTDFMIRLKAINTFGASPPSNVIYVRTTRMLSLPPFLSFEH